MSGRCVFKTYRDCASTRAGRCNINICIVGPLQSFCKSTVASIESYSTSLSCDRRTALVECCYQISVGLSRNPRSIILSAPPCKTVGRCYRASRSVGSYAVLNVDKSDRIVGNTCYKIFEFYKNAVVNVSGIKDACVSVRARGVSISFCYFSSTNVQFDVAICDKIVGV